MSCPKSLTVFIVRLTLHLILSGSLVDCDYQQNAFVLLSELVIQEGTTQFVEKIYNMFKIAITYLGAKGNTHLLLFCLGNLLLHFFMALTATLFCSQKAIKSSITHIPHVELG